jgi:serine/threonine-protein kinase RsbW
MRMPDINVEIKIPNQTKYLSLIGKIGEDIAKELDRFSGDRETLAYHMNLVLTEAMANAIKHANAGDPEKIVKINISITDLDLIIKVEDSGQGFDISQIPGPDFERLDDRGRGIFLIKSLMDTVCYSRLRSGNGNVLVMTKHLS